MPAKAATTQNLQVDAGRRRFLNLDLLIKVTVPLLVIFFGLIAWQMESFGWYSRLFRRNTYTTFLGSVGALYTLAFLAMQSVRTALWCRYRPRNRILPILDFVVRELEFPVTAIFLPLMLASFLCCPILIVKFVSGMAMVSFVLSSYYLRQEPDADFIYGVVYSFYAFYAFLFLRWVKPYAFFTLRNGRWLTR